jgi:hypothetical protein
MNKAIILALTGLLVVTQPANAHHSAAAYDEGKTASVTGVVTRLQWRNPHVIIRLDVTDESGNSSTWPLETAGLQRLVRDGWNKELLAPGTRLTAEIHPTKRGQPGGVLRWVTLEDGRVLAIDADSPKGYQDNSVAGVSTTANENSLQIRAKNSLSDYLARRAGVESQESSNRPVKLPKQTDGGQIGALDPGNLASHEGVPIYDFTGIWQHRSFRDLAKERGGFPWDFLPVPKLTPKSAAIHKEVMARRAAGDATADPATLCYPHGLVRTMTRAGNMMLLQQDTAVYMVHRMNNDFRTVFWDDREHVDSSVRVDTYNGDSIAYWEKDHLYVETIGFGSPFTYINSGIPIGPEGKIEERWRLVNNGNTLEIEFRMTDPEHWIGEWIDTKFWDRIHGTDIREGNCIVAEDAELAIGAEPKQ